MADLFSRKLKNNRGGFKIDSAKLTFSDLAKVGETTIGLLIQNVQIQYQQAVTFIYDLADPEGVYYVAGKAQGTLAMAKIVGSNTAAKAFYEKYGDACNVGGVITITGLGDCKTYATTGTAAAAEAKYKINAPLLVSYGMTMSVNEGTVGENIQMQFAQLELL